MLAHDLVSRYRLRTGMLPNHLLRHGQASVDGPSWVSVPETAAGWTGLSLPAPSAQWNCQDANTSLAPAIGAITISGTGSPTYANALPGWRRTFVGLPFAAAGAASQFHTTDAALDLASGESGAWLVYAALIGGDSGYLLYAGSHTNSITLSSVLTIRAVHASTIASATLTLVSAVVQPFLWYRNATTNVSGMLTLKQSLTNTHAEAALTGLLKGLGGAAAGSTRATAESFTGLMAFWKGADAETIATKATLVKLGWRLAW